METGSACRRCCCACPSPACTCVMPTLRMARVSYAHTCGIIVGACACVFCMLCVHAAVLLNTIVHTSMRCQVAYLLTSQRVHLVCVCLCRTLAAPRCWQAGEHPARPHPARLPDHVGSERDSTGATARPSDGLPACPPACTNCVQPSRLRHAALFLQHGA